MAETINFWSRFSTVTLPSSRKLRPYILLLLVTVVTISLYRHHEPVEAYLVQKWQMNAPQQVINNVTFGEPPQRRFKHPIMILQYNCHCQDSDIQELSSASQAQHEKYAKAHGYVYRVSSGHFLPDQEEGWRGSPFMNKMHLLLRIALEEIEREDGVDWIMVKDTDTLITDPAIAIHTMLPPDIFSPKPMMLGNQDFNGFNCGVAIYRVSHRLITYLSRMLAMEYHEVEPESSVTEQPKYATWPPSDQYATGIILQNYRDAQDRFFEISQEWFSSYYNPTDVPDITTIDTGSTIRGAIHLAGSLKHDWDWRGFLEYPERIYAQAEETARLAGVEGNGLDLMPSAELARREAEEWWSTHTGGIAQIRSNNI